MINFLSILIFMGAGAGSCLISYQLYKNFAKNYLGSYFYYNVCCLIFCIYSILCPLFIKEIIMEIEGVSSISNIISYVITFLGIPFLFVGWFMFLKFAIEFSSKKIFRYFLPTYISVTIIIFVSIGISLKYWGNEIIGKQNIIAAIVYLFMIIETLVQFFALFRLFSVKFPNEGSNKRKIFLFFSKYTLLGHLGSMIILFFSLQYEFLITIYMLAYVSKNILPIIGLRNYLYINCPTINESSNEKTVLEKLCKAYQISAREMEIILKIDEGKSNKEISDELYISLQTVKDHVYRIYQKVGVKSRVQLTNWLRSSN